MTYKTSIMPSQDSTASDFAKILFSVLLPPLGVALSRKRMQSSIMVG